jgi:hypothetical protein
VGDPVLVDGLRWTQEIFKRGPGCSVSTGAKASGAKRCAPRDGIFFD